MFGSDGTKVFERFTVAEDLGDQDVFPRVALAGNGSFVVTYERDTRGIATATGTDERVIGALVLAPAAFDTWRYFRPESRAARWGSRLSKVAFLGVILFKE